MNKVHKVQDKKTFPKKILFFGKLYAFLGK